MKRANLIFVRLFVCFSSGKQLSTIGRRCDFPISFFRFNFKRDVHKRFYPRNTATEDIKTLPQARTLTGAFVITIRFPWLFKEV